jgi:mono/diheme cytochrome c family protein
MAAGIVALGGAEWAREDLRKPYVIGRYMFVNGIRVPPGHGVLAETPEAGSALGADPFTVDALNQSGVLAATPWVRLHAPPPGSSGAAEDIAGAGARGAEVFRLECARCHTIDGYLAVRPLVAGRSPSALGGIISQLAKPVNAAGQAAAWSEPGVSLITWRGRRMPPFVGTASEREALAIYLAMLGGQPAAAIAAQIGGATDAGKSYFEEHCAACHGREADWPMSTRVRGRTPEQFYGLMGRLPSLSEAMPAFEGTDEQRRAVAAYMATLGTTAREKEDRR